MPSSLGHAAPAEPAGGRPSVSPVAEILLLTPPCPPAWLFSSPATRYMYQLRGPLCPPSRGCSSAPPAPSSPQTGLWNSPVDGAGCGRLERGGGGGEAVAREECARSDNPGHQESLGPARRGLLLHKEGVIVSAQRRAAVAGRGCIKTRGSTWKAPRWCWVCRRGGSQ